MGVLRDAGTTVGTSQRAPQVNLVRLRGALAERLISRRRFAAAAGLSYRYFNDILMGRAPAGELARYKLAEGCDVLDIPEVVTNPSSPEELLAKLA